MLTEDMDQLYRRTCFENIYIKDFITQDKRRDQEVLIILEQNITTTKTQRKNVVQWKTN